MHIRFDKQHIGNQQTTNDKGRLSIEDILYDRPLEVTAMETTQPNQIKVEVPDSHEAEESNGIENDQESEVDAQIDETVPIQQPRWNPNPWGQKETILNGPRIRSQSTNKSL
ncbi:hypothetical protein CHUAL_013496 [Chamberlinius hualienensis]